MNNSRVKTLESIKVAKLAVMQSNTEYHNAVSASCDEDEKKHARKKYQLNLGLIQNALGLEKEDMVAIVKEVSDGNAC